MNSSGHFARASSEFEAAHREDPKGYLLRYHKRLSHWVTVLGGEPSEALQLAARCQHIRRWKIPRSDFQAGLSGYKRWRTTLARFHGDQAAVILQDAGYAQPIIERVRALLLKKGLKVDAEVQLFEDAICLVFLENEFAEFATKHEDDKLVTIVQKTWKKMSPSGHAAALELAASLPPRLQDVLGRALDAGR